MENITEPRRDQEDVKMHGLLSLFDVCVDQIIDIQNLVKKRRYTKGSELAVSEHLKQFESLKMLRLSPQVLQDVRVQLRRKAQYKPGLAPFCSFGDVEEVKKLQAIDILIESLRNS